MRYHGKVKDGVVVFDGVKPPDGTAVDVAEAAAPDELSSDDGTPEQKAERLRQFLLELAKNSEQVLPTDASLNVDHYLYGHPKR